MGRRLPPLVGWLLVLAAWQGVVSFDLGILPLPSPGDVAEAATAMVVTSEFWTAAGQTLRVMVQGFIPGTALGILAGLAIGNIGWLQRGLGPLVFAIYTTPFIVFVPLLLVLFGFGVTGKTMIVFCLVIVTMTLQTIAGVERVDEVYWEVARSFGASQWARWFEVALPAAMPYVVIGVRLALARALVGVVVAEFQSSVTGLGGVILNRSQQLQLSEAAVPALFLCLIGIVINALLRRVEDRLRLWKA
jgi:ABC-type nitrate/sulfonate/bicarbonate transport system permease component